MATIIPSSNVGDVYEDMFKELTRKLYGEETGNGLHTLGTPVAQVATTGPTTPEGERSFTNLQIDRSSAPTIEYEHNAGAVGGASTAATTAVVAAAQNANVVIQQQPEGGSVVVATTGGNFKSEDHLSTAFNLAALMQNGFATTTGTILSTQALNKVTNANNVQQQQQQQQNDQQRWSGDGSTNSGGNNTNDQQQQQQQQTQIVQWTTTGGKLQSYATAQQQNSASSKTKTKNRNDLSNQAVTTTTEVIYTNPSTSAGNNILNTVVQQVPAPTTTTSATPSSGSARNSNGGGGGGGNNRRRSQTSNNNSNTNTNNTQQNGVVVVKRYPCSHCQYSTDRRDLFTRHENIHKDEKPFQCYACMKQFNRADHVKKHFVRMHREMEYDINKTRRHLPNSTNRHSGGRGNVTITTANTTNGGSHEQKPILHPPSDLQLDPAFLEIQRMPTSSSLSIAETIEAVASATDAPLPQMKQETVDDGQIGGCGGAGETGDTPAKPKREKRYPCLYCEWAGTDRWSLKRHINTHTKPYACRLCDYKAARSERLSTHCLKVHQKHVCNKCAFLGDTAEALQTHVNEVHPHDNRPSRNSNNSNNTNNATNNLNVLRTIGNTLVTNNQLNTFQNANATFGNTTTTTTNAIGNAGGSVTIYTTTTTNDNGNLTGGGGPLQEIIVNPQSMVGWRLSANGTLIPPHDLLTGALPNAAAQKRGSERLFNYLEAEESSEDDYARLIKMDAMDRNTASVAQDFHKAGGVHELLKLTTNNPQLLFNNKLPTTWTTKEAAAFLQTLGAQQFLQQQQQQQRSKYIGGNNSNNINNGSYNTNNRKRQRSNGDDDENTTPSTSPSRPSSSTSNYSITTPLKKLLNGRTPAINASAQQKKMPMTIFDLEETLCNELKNNQNSSKKIKLEIEEENNQEQLIKSPPAYNKIITTTTKTLNDNNSQSIKTTATTATTTTTTTSKSKRKIDFTTASREQQQQHCYDLMRDNKENTNIEAAKEAAALAIAASTPFLAASTPFLAASTPFLAASTPFLAAMEYQNMNNIIQNHIKDAIYNLFLMPMPAITAQEQILQQQQQQLQDQQPQPQQSQTTTKQQKSFLSETEQYIEYLKNKADITLTITPKNKNKSPNKSPLKRQLDLASPNVTLHRKPTPKKQINGNGSNSSSSNNNKRDTRKTISEIVTALPLLADAASKQEYLATPLDFSIKQENVSETTATTIATPSSILALASELQPTNNNSNITLATIKTETPEILPLPPSASNAVTPVTTTDSHHNRSSRKQVKPTKIRRSPKVIMANLRDKYLTQMVRNKLSCRICRKHKMSKMMVFNYHTTATLALHTYWAHKRHWEFSSV